MVVYMHFHGAAMVPPCGVCASMVLSWTPMVLPRWCMHATVALS